MSDDDDLGTTYDLDAWAPPAPSAGLADAVIARLRQPPAVVAIEPETSAAAPKAARRLIAGGIAGALAAAVIAVVVVGAQRREAAPSSGAVIADRARSLAFGDSRVQLDPGAELTWERDGSRVRAVLRQGAATFSVADDDTFVIDGASLASVEATGASLRMEANMNPSDARVIGTSTVTAAAVALLTIVVYEGHVAATHGGQSVNIQAGGTLDVRAPGPPAPVAVGAGPDYPAMLAEKDREIEALRKALDGQQSVATGDGQNRAAPKQPPPPRSCDFDVLAAKGDDHAAAGRWAAALSTWEQALACKPDLLVLRKAAMAACNSKNAAKANVYLPRLDKTSATGVLQICIRNGTPIKVASPDCVTSMRDIGDKALQDGRDADALRSYEAALACGGGTEVEKLAMMSACRAQDVERARRHAARLSDADRNRIAQICLRNGIDVSDVRATGALRVQSMPPARVFVDGKDTGKTTPMAMTIAAGKHKITFQVGDSKYTFSVVVEPGQTTSLVKSLE